MFLHRDQIESDLGRIDLAFTDRHGGVSAPPFDSLDLSRSREGRDDELRTNLERLATAFGVRGFATMTQVHGAEVREVHGPGPVETPCDALITTDPDVALCVRVGDCVPVLLVDLTTGTIAVAHAGRAGVAGGVVPNAVAAMRRARCRHHPRLDRSARVRWLLRGAGRDAGGDRRCRAHGLRLHHLGDSLAGPRSSDPQSARAIGLHDPSGRRVYPRVCRPVLPSS